MKYYTILIAAILLPLAFIVGCSADDPVSKADSQVTISVSPEDGATNVSTSTSFVVTFSRAMDHANAESSFMLHHGWGVGGMTHQGSFSWNQEGTIMTFVPTMPLDSGATYTVHMMGMMRGMNGMDYHPMFDSSGMSGSMMGGMNDDEIRTTCSTGRNIRRQIDLNLTGDVIYVAEGGSGDIAVIDAVTNTLIGIQPVVNVGFLHHLSLSPDRTMLIVSDPGEDMSSGGSGGHGGAGEHGGMMMDESHILVLNSITLLEVGRLDIEGVVHNATVTPNGLSLLFNNADHSALHKYSFPGLVSQSSYAVGAGPLEVTITPDGQYALTANSGANTISRVHLTMDMAVDNISAGTTPVGAWISPDGRTAWVNNESSKSVTVLTIDPFAVDTNIALGFTPGQAFVNPVRPEAYVADEDNGKIIVFSTDTYARLAEISTGAGAHGIAYSPDGSKAFVTNEHAMSVSVIDTGTRTVVATISVGMKPNGIVYRRAL